MKTIKLDSSESFTHHVTSLIEKRFNHSSSPIRIGVPGGRGAKSVVMGILALNKDILPRVALYLIDERLSGETNRETLLHYGLKEAMKRGEFLTNQLIIPRIGAPFIENGVLDVLFVGVGEDGHFASLFPHSYNTTKDDDIVLVTDSPKPPLERLSISYAGAKRYAQESLVFLLFFGEAKRDAYEKFLHKGDVEDLPVRYFLDNDYDVTLVTDIE